jgi:AbrB family looped-hinge helix DNA binding protein
MRSAIDSAGRLVIPKEIRREAGLRPGMPLRVRWRDGCIEIEPVPLAVASERRGRLMVAVPRGEVPELRADDVEAVRRAVDCEPPLRLR